MVPIPSQIKTCSGLVVSSPGILQHVKFYLRRISWCYLGVIMVSATSHQSSSNSVMLKWSTSTSGVPRNFFRGGVQQIQLRTEGREDGDLGAVAP